MNNQDLIAIGKYLYGERWQSPLSREINVSDRTIRAWLQGTRKISEGAADEIYQLAAVKQFEASLPLLEDTFRQNGIPEMIELTVHSGNTESIHKHPWSNEADYYIKTWLASMLTESGIPAEVKRLS